MNVEEPLIIISKVKFIKYNVIIHEGTITLNCLLVLEINENYVLFLKLLKI